MGHGVVCRGSGATGVRAAAGTAAGIAVDGGGAAATDGLLLGAGIVGGAVGAGVVAVVYALTPRPTASDDTPLSRKMAARGETSRKCAIHVRLQRSQNKAIAGSVIIDQRPFSGPWQQQNSPAGQAGGRLFWTAPRPVPAIPSGRVMV